MLFEGTRQYFLPSSPTLLDLIKQQHLNLSRQQVLVPYTNPNKRTLAFLQTRVPLSKIFGVGDGRPCEK